MDKSVPPSIEGTSSSSSSGSMDIGSPPSLSEEAELGAPLGSKDPEKKSTLQNLNRYREQQNQHKKNIKGAPTISVTVSVTSDDEINEDDEEIISLEHQHRFRVSPHYLHQHQHQHIIPSSSLSNGIKTPSQNSSTLRRTPGANAMHRSAFNNKNVDTTPLNMFRGLDLHYTTPTNSATSLKRTPGGVNVTTNISMAPISSLDSAVILDEANKSCVMEDPLVLKPRAIMRTRSGEITSENSKNHMGGGVLGFGLTLNSPVGVPKATHQKENLDADREELNGTNYTKKILSLKKTLSEDGSMSRSNCHKDARTPMASNVSITPSVTKLVRTHSDIKRVPSLEHEAPGDSRGYVYTPAVISLAKNQELDIHPLAGAISPNTIRLTENLNKLMSEEDDEIQNAHDSSNAYAKQESDSNMVNESNLTLDSFTSRHSSNDDATVSEENNHRIGNKPNSTFSPTFSLNKSTLNHHRDQHRGHSSSPSTIHNSSFGTDSYASLPSKGKSNENWFDTYTVDSGVNILKSKDGNRNHHRRSHTLNLSCTSNTLPRPNTIERSKTNFKAANVNSSLMNKPFHRSSFHKFTRANTSRSSSIGSDNCTLDEGNQRVKHNDENSTSPPRPVNFDPYPTGAFVSTSKHNISKSTQEPVISIGDGNGTLHNPKPKKATKENSNSGVGGGNYQCNQHDQLHGVENYEGGNFIDNNDNPIIIHNHHYYHGFPDSTMNNNGGYQFDSGASSGQYHYDTSMCPPNLHGQYQQHSSVPEGAPMDYNQPHLLQTAMLHSSLSPVTIPPVTSPLTVPTYPIHHTSMPYQPSISPIPFAAHPHFSNHTSWSTQPHPGLGNYTMHSQDLNGSHRDGSWDFVPNSWEQQTGYSFSGDMYVGRGDMLPPLSTPTPPSFSPIPPSWIPSDYNNFGNAQIMPNHHHTNYVGQIPPPQQIHHQTQMNASIEENGNFQQQENYNEKQKQSVPNNSIQDNNYMQSQSFHERTFVKESKCSNHMSQNKNVLAHANENLGRGGEFNRRKTSKKETKRRSKSIQKNKNTPENTNHKENAPITQAYDKSSKNISAKENTENTSQNNSTSTRHSVIPDKSKRTSNKEVRVERIHTESVENPLTRSAFKDFYRKFRIQEKISLTQAKEFAIKSLRDKSITVEIHWKIYLELADLSKRANNFVEARKLFQLVCTLQPYASQGWLEYSKLEEECGDFRKCSNILHKGLSYCEYNENLLTRAIKHEERIAYEKKNGDLRKARQLLSRLKHVGIEKVWRVVLEGGMLEARAGRMKEARRVLKYLMHWVPWYGPLYLEAYKLERDSGNSQEALNVVERGLKEIPRYGPLWFGAFRLSEAIDLSCKNYDLPRTKVMVKRAVQSISKELLWKVFLEWAQAQERSWLMFHSNNNSPSSNECLELCRQSFALSVLVCSDNLSWKVWLAAGKMELSAGNPKIARKLFLKAYGVVPAKGRPSVLLECARLEEFIGNVKTARAILCKARNDAGSDWKVWLESISLEMRMGCRNRAIAFAQDALSLHTGTGRLWAALIQLSQPDYEVQQMHALKCALGFVPKSGEVWCESARIFLNPFSPSFDLDTAKKHLEFAIKFTPQYGDSFLEMIRLQLLQKWIVPISTTFFERLENYLTEEFGAFNRSHNNNFNQMVGTIIQKVVQDVKDLQKSSETVTDSLFSSDLLHSTDSKQLELRCCNADPNYGKLWFHCRLRQTDTARDVIRYAKEVIAEDLKKYAYVYVSALMRMKSKDVILNNCIKSNLDCLEQDKISKSFPSLSELNNRCVKDDGSSEEMLFLENNISGFDFVIGIVKVNSQESLEKLSLFERRKVLFGSDLLPWKPA